MTRKELEEVAAKALYHSQYWSRPEGVEWTDVQRAAYEKDARAALSAIEGAGFAVVPVVPDEGMIWAGWRAPGKHFSGSEGPKEQTSAVWSAMLSASKV